MDQELTILLIEDDSDTRENLRDILEIDGHTVQCAGSAEEAKRVAQTSRAQIIILDRQLPDGRAELLLPDLVKLIHDVHVIVVTGYADLDSTIAAFRAGAADFILKPVNPDGLRNRIKHIARTRHAEIELRQKREFSDRILRTADAIILVLDLQGNVIQFNDYFHRVAGWTEAELVGKNWFDHCIPEDERERIQHVFIQTARQASSHGIENPIQTHDGRIRHIRWSNNILTDSQGITNAVLAVGIDITEYREVQQQLLRSERLAGIGQTMTALAHESRNALQRIHAGVELLEEITAGQEETKKDLAVIKRAANDLNGILEEVRSFAAPIHLHVDACDMVEVFRQAWRNVALLHPSRNVEFIEELDKRTIYADVDSLRMEQVFRNLFENSLAATEDPVKILVRCETGDDHCRFVVCDNGPGMSTEQRERVFEPFYTTKSSGTGLGMAIVKRIVSAHHGSVEVLPAKTDLETERSSNDRAVQSESIADMGTQVAICLPLQFDRKPPA